MVENDNIKEILEKADLTGSEASDSVEFEFSKNPGVVFENSVGVEKKDSRVISFGEEGEPESPLPKDLEKASLTEDEKTDSLEEFNIPDSFNIVEESEEISKRENAGIWTTYVPRFTEVSERYRMSGAGIAVNHGAEAKKTEEDIDPTAELGSNDENVKLVSFDVEKLSEEQRKTVYKFSDSSQKESKIKIRTVEDELREIDELMKSTDGESAQVPNECYEEMPRQEAEVDAPAKEADDSPKTISDSAIEEANRKTKPELAFEKKESAPLSTGEFGGTKRRGSEFSSPPQRDNFKDRFLDQILSIKVRLIVASVLTVVILLFENLQLFGVDLFEALKIPKYTGVPVILDFEIAACIFILALPEMINAVVQLLRGRVSSEISVILSLLVLAVYSVAVFALELNEYALFGFLFSVHVIAALFAAYLKKSTDFSSFRLISSKKKKNVLTVSPTKNMQLENMALDGAVDSYKSKTVSTVETAFVSEFFKRCGEAAEKNLTTLVMMGISVGVAIVCGTVAYFVNDGISSFLTASSLVFLMSMPAFSVITNKFIYAHAAGALKKVGAAVIGQGALSEYADADVMVFRDVEIFGEEDVKLRNFSGDMTKGMRQMCALFSSVGGPLDKIFSSAVDRKCSPASAVKVEAFGISGTVDGHVILAGSEAYMHSHGAAFENEGIRLSGTGADSTKIMYAAEDGKIYAGFRISYSFTESFTMILPSLREKKIIPLVVTRDPNVSNELVRTLTMGGDAIRVLKKSDVASKESTASRAAAGIVTVGENASATSALLLAKRGVALMARLELTEIMALGVGAALGIALSLGGMVSAPTAALGLWQLSWCVGVGFLSLREFLSE